MDGATGEDGAASLSRRGFLKTAASAGAGLALAGPQIVPAETLRSDTLNCAVIGAGNQCRVLLTDCIKIPGLRFRGVCDIWPYHRGYTTRLLKAYKHEPKAYADHREMLAELGDLDAVIVASPDWVHAEHTIACLGRGIHVYCEKEMSNSVEQARQMVLAARKAGKLLQIGHQRRSNPRYHKALQYIEKNRALGRITGVSGQWNRHKLLEQAWRPGTELDAAALAASGYGTMRRFRNWRWYRKFSGGPIADLGSHQIDVFHWFLGARPKSVMASGGVDNYEHIEWYDNVVAVYEWDYTWQGRTRTVRGTYGLMSTSSHGGYFEAFMGTEGSLVISERWGTGGIRREYAVPMADWEKELAAATRAKAPDPAAKAGADARDDDGPKVGHSVPEPGRYYGPIPVPKAAAGIYMPHLVNFFEAVRKDDPKHLTCPGEVGFATAVSVLRVNDAVDAARELPFSPEEFRI